MKTDVALVSMPAVKDYRYGDAEHTWSHHDILPKVAQILAERDRGSRARALDLGCGNGSLANRLSQRDFEVVGVDPSASGISHARQAYPAIEFRQLGREDVLKPLGHFDPITCLKVVEHCYDPWSVVHKIHHLLKPGGIPILSTRPIRAT